MFIDKEVTKVVDKPVTDKEVTKVVDKPVTDKKVTKVGDKPVTDKKVTKVVDKPVTDKPNTAVVSKGKHEIRRYTEKIHGKNFLELAREFAKRHRYAVESKNVKAGMICSACGHINYV